MLMPRLPAVGVGAREDHGEIGHRRVVDPQLAAVEPPAGGRPGRRRADARHVGPGLGFGDRVGGAPPRLQQRGEVALVLRRRAVLRQQGGHQLDQPALIGNRRVAAGELLHHDGVGHAVRAGPAQLLRDGDAEEPQLRHLAVQVFGKALARVELDGDRADLRVGKLPGGVPDERVALVAVVHGGSSLRVADANIRRGPDDDRHDLRPRRLRLRQDAPVRHRRRSDRAGALARNDHGRDGRPRPRCRAGADPRAAARVRRLPAAAAARAQPGRPRVHDSLQGARVRAGRRPARAGARRRRHQRARAWQGRPLARRDLRRPGLRDGAAAARRGARGQARAADRRRRRGLRDCRCHRLRAAGVAAHTRYRRAIAHARWRRKSRTPIRASTSRPARRRSMASTC